VYIEFGNHIDPEQFFTVENMKELNLTVEDFEKQAGLPIDWTNVGFGTVEE
jgi:predicted amino acid racemase